VINDWFMTAIQPILLHDEFQNMDQSALDLLRQSTPRSHCNLRTFCMLVGLLVKQGHLESMSSRQKLMTLFASLMTPRSPYQMDHLFTSLLTHIGQTALWGSEFHVRPISIRTLCSQIRLFSCCSLSLSLSLRFAEERASSFDPPTSHPHGGQFHGHSPS
jgi:hypothetical protein